MKIVPKWDGCPENAPQFTFDEYIERDWKWISDNGLDKPVVFQHLEHWLQEQMDPARQEEQFRSNVRDDHPNRRKPKWDEHVEFCRHMAYDLTADAKTWKEIRMPIDDCRFCWREEMENMGLFWGGAEGGMDLGRASAFADMSDVSPDEFAADPAKALGATREPAAAKMGNVFAPKKKNYAN